MGCRDTRAAAPIARPWTVQTRMAIEDYLRLTNRKLDQFLFADRADKGGLTTRQYPRLVQKWVASIRCGG